MKNFKTFEQLDHYEIKYGSCEIVFNSEEDCMNIFSFHSNRCVKNHIGVETFYKDKI